MNIRSLVNCDPFPDLKKILTDCIFALKELAPLERWLHCFWLCGPFILLVERSPADIWLSFISISFLSKSLATGDWSWMRVNWVVGSFVFLIACFLSASMSPNSVDSFGEAIAWFRFPLFAAACTFWLGKDKRILYGMLISTGTGMLLMSLILLAEYLIVGQTDGRLTWPYGDYVPGSYLTRVGMPAFCVAVALAVGVKGRLSIIMGLISCFTIFCSGIAGEKINFLIRACGGGLAALVWKSSLRKFLLLLVVEALAISPLIYFSSSLAPRFNANIVNEMPFNEGSDYYRVMNAGFLVFDKNPTWGVGAGQHRSECSDIVGVRSDARCDNHPHNYYIQFLAEVGLPGFFAGVYMICAIIWSCFSGFLKNRSNVVVATAFIIPLGIFFPIQSTGDFFGQWHNIFSWSAIGLALASARNLSKSKARV